MLAHDDCTIASRSLAGKFSDHASRPYEDRSPLLQEMCKLRDADLAPLGVHIHVENSLYDYPGPVIEASRLVRGIPLAKESQMKKYRGEFWLAGEEDKTFIGEIKLGKNRSELSLIIPFSDKPDDGSFLQSDPLRPVLGVTTCGKRITLTDYFQAFFPYTFTQPRCAKVLHKCGVCRFA